MEGHTVLWFHSSFHRCVRGSFWTLWSWWPARSHNHSNRSASRLLLFVAVCIALVPAPFSRDTHTADWSRCRNHYPARASVSSGRRRDELGAQANCCTRNSAASSSPRPSEPLQGAHTLEP